MVPGLADSGASDCLWDKDFILAKGRKTNTDGPRLKFTKAASQELGSSLRPVMPGTVSVPLVNSE